MEWMGFSLFGGWGWDGETLNVFLKRIGVPSKCKEKCLFLPPMGFLRCFSFPASKKVVVFFYPPPLSGVLKQLMGTGAFTYKVASARSKENESELVDSFSRNN